MEQMEKKEYNYSSHYPSDLWKTYLEPAFQMKMKDSFVLKRVFAAF